jgi:Ca2+-binding EF-hand superfamily protein
MHDISTEINNLKEESVPFESFTSP